MKTPEEWATIALQLIFRKDFEVLIAQIQADAQKDLKEELAELKKTWLEHPST